MRSTRAYLLCQALGWSLYGALVSVALFSSPGVSRSQAIAAVVCNVVTMAALSHGLRAAWRRRRWLERPLLGQAWRLSIAAFVLGPVSQFLLVALMVGVVRLYTFEQTSPLVFAIYSVQATGIFVGWQVLYVGLHAIDRSRRAEAERVASLAAARDAELKALRTQLNPHFLFNALNTVRGLIAEDPPRAQEAVTRLSTLLRYTLAASEHARVSLEQELEVVNDYLALEQLRFEARLQVAIDVDAEVRAVQVPVMLLQTLVENAVKHGISRAPQGGTVAVTARREVDALRLEVRNPLPSRPGQSDGAQVGVANTTERLRLLYGDRASFTLTTEGQQVCATVKVPL